MIQVSAYNYSTNLRYAISPRLVIILFVPSLSCLRHPFYRFLPSNLPPSTSTLSPPHPSTPFCPFPSDRQPFMYYDSDRDNDSDSLAPCPGPAAIPSPRSRFAPYLSRRVDVFEDFLEDFEDHANACKLSDPQRVDAIVRYIDSSSHEFCESGIGFRSRDWISFRQIRVVVDFFSNFRMTCFQSGRRN